MGMWMNASDGTRGGDSAAACSSTHAQVSAATQPHVNHLPRRPQPRSMESRAQMRAATRPPAMELSPLLSLLLSPLPLPLPAARTPVIEAFPALLPSTAAGVARLLPPLLNTLYRLPLLLLLSLPLLMLLLLFVLLLPLLLLLLLRMLTPPPLLLEARISSR